MRIIDVKKITVASGDEVLLNFCNNLQGDNVVGEMYIQTKEDVAFSIKGTVDGENYETVKLFNMASYSILDEAEDAGYFMIPCAGLQSAKIVAGSAGDLVVKLTY